MEIQASGDPLDNPTYVYTNAPAIDPERLRGRSFYVLHAYARRVNDNFGESGLGPEQKTKIAGLLREDVRKDMTESEIAKLDRLREEERKEAAADESGAPPEQSS